MSKILKINKIEIQWKLHFIIVGLLFMIISLHRSKILNVENIGGSIFVVITLVLYFSVLVFGFFIVLSIYRITQIDTNIVLNDTSLAKI